MDVLTLKVWTPPLREQLADLPLAQLSLLRRHLSLRRHRRAGHLALVGLESAGDRGSLVGGGRGGRELVGPQAELEAGLEAGEVRLAGLEVVAGAAATEQRWVSESLGG